MDLREFEKKMKHLEFVQGVITRMNSNSFSMKGWAITIVAAFLAVFASQNKNESYLFISIIPTFLFWILDAHYLQMEKKYRRLFGDINVGAKNNFDMDVRGYEVSFWESMFSKTEWPLYLVMILALLMGGVLGCLGIY